VSPTATSRATSSPDSSANLPTTDETLTYSSRSGVVLTLPGRTWQTTNYFVGCLVRPGCINSSPGFSDSFAVGGGRILEVPVYPGFGLSCAHFWSSRRLQSQWAQRGRSPGFTLVVPLYVGPGSRCATGPDRARPCPCLPDGNRGDKERPRRDIVSPATGVLPVGASKRCDAGRHPGAVDSYGCRTLDAFDAFGPALAEPRAHRALEERGCTTRGGKRRRRARRSFFFPCELLGNPPPVPCNVAADDSGRPANDPGRKVKGCAMNFPKRNFMTVP
jgi:hypothetical protein